MILDFIHGLLIPIHGSSESMKHRILSAFGWNIGGNIGSMGINFGTNIILARQMGQETFGKWSLLIQTLVTLTAVAQLSTAFTATRFIAEWRTTFPEKAGRVLALCRHVSLIAAIFSASCLALSAPFLAGMVLEAPDLSPHLVFLSALLVFQIINSFLIGALSGLEKYFEVSKSQFTGAIINCLVAIPCAQFYGIWGGLLGLFACQITQNIILRYSLRKACQAKNIPWSPPDFLKERALLWKFSLPAALGGLIGMPAGWFGQAMLARQIDGFAAIAGFNVASGLKGLMMFGPNTLFSVNSSILSNLYGENQIQKFNRLFWINLGSNLIAVLLFGCLFYIFGETILSFYGSSFRAAYPTLLVLIIVALPETLGTACYQIIQVKSRLWYSFLGISLPRDFSLVLGCYYLIPRFQDRGFAYALLGAHTLGFLATAFGAWRYATMPSKTTSDSHGEPA